VEWSVPAIYDRTEKAMTGKRVDLTTCVWGEWHMDTMRRVMLPTLLSPRNLPALTRRFPSLYRIATTPSDRARIEAWPIFARLAETVEIEWITENPSPDIAYHIKWYERVLSDAKAKGAYCLMLYPDVAWNDGALDRCADAIAAGKVGVAIPYIRVISETFVPDIASRGTDRAIILPGGELARLGMRHMHPLSVAALSGACHALPSLEASWRIPGQGLLLREMSRELSLVDTERLQANRYWNIVDTDHPEELHVATDSDDMFMLSLAPLFKDFQVYIPNHALQSIDLARVSLHPSNDNPLVNYYAAHSIRLHYDSLDKNRWRPLERRADHFIDRALVLREFLRLWEVAHARECRLASQAMSVGLFATSLVHGWRRTAPVTAYIPTDAAFGDGDALAPLLSSSAAKDLKKLIVAHVALGVADPAEGSWEQTTLNGAPLHCRADSEGEFVNDAQIIDRIELPPHRICIIDRLLAPISLAADLPAAPPSTNAQIAPNRNGPASRTMIGRVEAREDTSSARSQRGRFAKVIDNVRIAAGKAINAVFPGAVADKAPEIFAESIAQAYPRFLRRFGIKLDNGGVERQKRSAAAALYQAGLYRHKLLFMYDLMARLRAQGEVNDPQPAFFEYCSSLVGDEKALIEAERYYGLALQLVPDFAEALYARALLKRRAGATTEALALFEAAAQAPCHPKAMSYALIAANAWRNLAEMFRDRGDQEAAEACFRKALAHHGIHGVYHGEIAQFLQKIGSTAEAAREYERMMPYSHLYPSEFSEPDYPLEDRLPSARNGHPCDPLKPTIIEEDANGGRLVYWWHLYLSVPRTMPIDALSLMKSRPTAYLRRERLAED
jgi:tetratricopeptide (TPR) repeat protein